MAKYAISEINERGQTEPLELPDEYPDDDHRYVDPERIVRERIDRKERNKSVATGTMAF